MSSALVEINLEFLQHLVKVRGIRVTMPSLPGLCAATSGRGGQAGLPGRLTFAKLLSLQGQLSSSRNTSGAQHLAGELRIVGSTLGLFLAAGSGQGP